MGQAWLTRVAVVKNEESREKAGKETPSISMWASTGPAKHHKEVATNASTGCERIRP
jgi:hypothetical protein